MGVNWRNIILYGADIQSIISPYLKDSEDSDFIDSLYDRYDPANKGTFVYAADGYESKYIMFGVNIFTSDDGRNDSADIPLTNPVVSPEWDGKIRAELLRLLPDEADAIASLQFKLWVFTQFS